jgi:hypothetical protein
MKVYLNENQAIEVAKGNKIHHLVSFRKYKDDAKIIGFYEDVKLNILWLEENIKATQNVFMGLDPQGIFFIMIDNRVLTGEEMMRFARNEGFLNAHQLFMAFEPKMKPHKFYKLVLECKLIHFLFDSRYEGIKTTN